MLRLAVVVCAVTTLTQFLASGGVFGSHPYPGSQQLNINYLHAAFEAGGGGRISYRLCDDFGRGVPWEWENGVEKWDSALGPSFEFDPVTSCSSALDGSALLRWGAPGFCGPGYLACWQTWTNANWYVAHGSHNDILLGQIVFETGDWDILRNWRSYMDTLEWLRSE